MKKIIITDKPDKFATVFAGVNVIDVKGFNEAMPEVWDPYANEYKPYLICKAIGEDKAIIAIDFEMKGVDKYLLAHHLISTCKDAVILFVADTRPENLSLEDDFGLFRNKFINVLTVIELLAIFSDKEETTRHAAKYASDMNFKNYVDSYQRFLVLDRHQATNEWGAIKLLLHHGLKLQVIEAAYALPKTVYFKQKIAAHNLTDSTTVEINSYSRKTELQAEQASFKGLANGVTRILLIDDNAKKGWQFALSKIFPAATIDIEVCYEDAKAIKKFSQFDLIFLDLRLPKSKTSGKPEIQHGKELIKKIKDDNDALYIPLIVFTASQTARTLHDILEAGADAMFVKESPDWDAAQSLENYHDFLYMLNAQIQKGAELSVYWKAIEKIKMAFLPEIVDATNFEIKKRIIERLEMFYGLLKKKHEEFGYNKSKFHFSADILGFMTLWSILNEIQEAYFEKGNVPIENWKVKSQLPDKFFLKIHPPSAAYPGLFSDFQLKRYSAAPFYEFDRRGIVFRKKDYRQLLSLQIAFLIMSKTKLKSSPKKSDYLKILKDTNDQRNKLYLTHGENIARGFYAKLERNKPVPADMTTNLFKLVTFLLTGLNNII